MLAYLFNRLCAYACLGCLILGLLFGFASEPTDLYQPFAAELLNRFLILLFFLACGASFYCLFAATEHLARDYQRYARRPASRRRGYRSLYE